jgi:hypothetical protein
MGGHFLNLFLLSFHQLGPVSSEAAGEIRKVLEGVQAGLNIRLVGFEVSNVPKEMLNYSVPQICLRYSKQVTVPAEHDLNNVDILRSSKVVVPSAFIMNYLENEGIVGLLVNFNDLLLNDSLVLCPYEGVNQEDVEHRVHSLKNVFLDQPMSISHWHKHWMLEVVVELYLYAAIVYQGFRMSLEGAIKNMVREGRASLGGLVRVG